MINFRIFRLLVLIFVALVVAQVNDWQPLDRLIVGGIALLVFAYLWSWQSLRNLDVRRVKPEERAQVGQIFFDTFILQNRSNLGKLWVEIRDHSSLPGHIASRVINIGRKKTIEWSVQTICSKRGRFHLGPVSVRSGDPFGIFPSRWRDPKTLEMLVYPAVIELPSFALPAASLTGGPTTNRRAQTVTPMVTGIRDYTQGDAFNRISWTATARLGRLMVKEFDVDPTSDVWIVLDLDRAHHVVSDRRRSARAGDWDGAEVEQWLDSTEEYAVAIAASIGRSCLNQGRGIGLIATGAHYEVVQAERSDRTYIKLLEALAVVAADGHRPLAEVLIAEARRFNRNSAVIVITSSTDPTCIDALAMIAARRAQATVVFVDGSSFSDQPGGTSLLEGLVNARVRTYHVRNGDRIADALRAAAV
jgi:uncharacterized protein (DUF58 family)